LKGRSPREIQPEIARYLDLFKLNDKADTEARKLSRGMQQKLATAVALIAQSRVVLLDEPTLGLDVQASLEIRDLLKRIVQDEGRTVNLPYHDRSVVQATCERRFILNEGRIVAVASIEHLLDLFQVKGCRHVIGESPTPAQQQAIQALPQVLLEEENN